MQISIRNISSLKLNPLTYAFLVPLLYWGYLLFTSHMLIQYDSINYEKLGRLLAGNPWVEYFKTGPNREPIYPILISFSMRIGDILSISYQKVHTVVQILILLFTQILSLKILQKLNVSRAWCALAIFYMGISPALVNSAFSLYSEIAVYPFVLGIILLAGAAWQNLGQKKHDQRIFLYAVALAFLFVLSTGTKAAFELIFPVFLIPFLLLGVYFIKQKNIAAFQRTLLFIALAVLIFYPLINFYKGLNKTYNGQFVITDRGAWALYGNTDRRMAPLTSQRLLVALAYVPGEGVCNKYFSEKECSFWSFRESDGRGFIKESELKGSGLEKGKVNQELISLALNKVKQNPAQYLLFISLEGLKMLFWESTRIGFVSYPDWLENLFQWPLFKDGLRLVLFLLTFAGIIYSLIYWGRKRAELFDFAGPISTLFMILLMIILFIGAYSFFFTLTRYSLPIAPLFIILMAFWADKTLKKN